MSNPTGESPSLYHIWTRTYKSNIGKSIYGLCDRQREKKKQPSVYSAISHLLVVRKGRIDTRLNRVTAPRQVCRSRKGPQTRCDDIPEVCVVLCERKEKWLSTIRFIIGALVNPLGESLPSLDTVLFRGVPLLGHIVYTPTQLLPVSPDVPAYDFIYDFIYEIIYEHTTTNHMWRTYMKSYMGSYVHLP